jgi:hypothetical protein
MWLQRRLIMTAKLCPQAMEEVCQIIQIGVPAVYMNLR